MDPSCHHPWRLTSAKSYKKLTTMALEKVEYGVHYPCLSLTNWHARYTVPLYIISYQPDLAFTDSNLVHAYVPILVRAGTTVAFMQLCSTGRD